MAQLGSVCGIDENALIVSGKKKECSVASARSNCFCASGEHEVLNSTRPSFSGLELGVAVTSAADAAAASDRATIVTSRTFRGYFMIESSRRRRARGPAMDGTDLTSVRESPGAELARAVPGECCFLREQPCRIVPIVLVDLIDGRFELFRYFLSLAATFDRSAPEELRERSAWSSGPWWSSRPTVRWPRPRSWPPPMRASTRSSCARRTRTWRGAYGATGSSNSIGARASCVMSRWCGRSLASRPH